MHTRTHTLCPEGHHRYCDIKYYIVIVKQFMELGKNLTLLNL